MSNISQFNEISALIFPKLYEVFPSKLDLRVSDYPDFDNEESSSIFINTVSFYFDEGYIKYDDQLYGGFFGVRLTSKGFSILNIEAPVKLEIESNLVGAIKDAAETGKKELIKSLVSTVIKYGSSLL
ncbi:hypothetical protein CLV44_1053 [Marinobacterium halophilum]|uniref:Uncharacterized protein n=1 Tax=Marinobacterium halophilum TaxID=267374 RepID=A0A2P8F058_9GAMM|nr:hypothetical protein [Marinobacterium halophilum]PSL15109.1 hypothetical protein CLV44_1053 [Marinobacterium halophilum]